MLRIRMIHHSTRSKTTMKTVKTLLLCAGFCLFCVNALAETANPKANNGAANQVSKEELERLWRECKREGGRLQANSMAPAGGACARLNEINKDRQSWICYRNADGSTSHCQWQTLD